jgi:hypothetical protein
VSGSHLEQSGDERRLAPDVFTADVSNVPFPDHRHRLVAHQRSSRCLEAAKAKARAGQAFHIPMVLLALLWQFSRFRSYRLRFAFPI